MVPLHCRLWCLQAIICMLYCVLAWRTMLLALLLSIITTYAYLLYVLLALLFTVQSLFKTTAVLTASKNCSAYEEQCFPWITRLLCVGDEWRKVMKCFSVKNLMVVWRRCQAIGFAVAGRRFDFPPRGKYLCKLQYYYELLDCYGR